MDSTQFQENCTGRLTPTIEGMMAFVPNPLPPEIDLNEIILLFAEASAALGGLNKIGSTIANPYMVIRPLQRNEALRSSAMEGTYSTADNLAIAEALDTNSARGADREVLDYIYAIDFAVEQINSLPISHRIIRGMHEILLRRASASRGANKRPGEYKIHQNWIGAPHIQDARFIPPPPDAASVAMDDLEKFINEDFSYLPPLLMTALTHYQFETIHPFGDGNGRVGRMLITLQLLTNNLLDAPLLYVSPFIEANKDEYIDSMFAVSVDGDWNRWLTFFLTAIRASCDYTIETITRLNQLRDDFRQTLQENSKSVSAISICEHLFESPVTTISAAAKISGTSYQSAKKNVERLVDFGILAPVDGIENPKLFWAKSIIDVSDGLGRKIDKF